MDFTTVLEHPVYTELSSNTSKAPHLIKKVQYTLLEVRTAWLKHLDYYLTIKIHGARHGLYFFLSCFNKGQIQWSYSD